MSCHHRCPGCQEIQPKGSQELKLADGGIMYSTLPACHPRVIEHGYMRTPQMTATEQENKPSGK